MKNALLIAPILGVGAIIYFSFKQVTVESPQAAPPPSEFQTAHSAQQEDISPPLQAALPSTAIFVSSKLNSSLANQEENMQFANENSATPSTTTNEAQTNQDRDVEIQKMLKFIEGKSNKSIADTMRLEFENETTDYEWSSTYEQKVHDFFRESPAFSNFSPTEIQCKSSYCRVVVIATDDVQTEEASKSIMASIGKSSLGNPNKSLFVVNEVAGQIEFYFARDAESHLY